MLKFCDFGFSDGINEVIAITFGEWINTAPIGVIVEDEESDRAVLRLYKSHTRENVERDGRVWINVNYDPIVWAVSSFDDLDEGWFLRINPPVIRGSVAWCELRCRKVKEGEPAEFEAKLVKGEIVGANFRPVNRGFNALIELLVHATRYIHSRDEGLLRRIRDLEVVIRKCGGRGEKRALDYVLERIR